MHLGVIFQMPLRLPSIRHHYGYSLPLPPSQIQAKKRTLAVLKTLLPIHYILFLPLAETVTPADTAAATGDALRDSPSLRTAPLRAYSSKGLTKCKSAPVWVGLGSQPGRVESRIGNYAPISCPNTLAGCGGTLKSIHDRHPDVDQGNIHRILLQQIEGIAPVRCLQKPPSAVG